MAEDTEPEWHDGPGWRTLAPAVVFLTVLTALSLWFSFLAFGLICLAGAVGGAFVTGYCLRQQVLNTGSTPRFKFLRLKEDEARMLREV